MRFIFLGVSLALLVLVSCGPNENFKNDFRQAVENTKFQIGKIELNFLLSVAKVIVDMNVADHSEIEKLQNFIDKWQPDKKNATEVAQFRKEFSYIFPQVSKSKLSIIICKCIGGTCTRKWSETELEETQNFIDKWHPCNISLIHNTTQLYNFLTRSNEFEPQDDGAEHFVFYDQYMKGSFSVLKSKFEDLVADQHEALKTKGSEIIRVAKESGYTNDFIEQKFNEFVRADRKTQESKYMSFEHYLFSEFNAFK